MSYIHEERVVLLALPGLRRKFRLSVASCGVADALSILPAKGGLRFRILKTGLGSDDLEERARRHLARGRPHLLTRYDLARPVVQAAARDLPASTLGSSGWRSFLRNLEDGEGFLGPSNIPTARETYAQRLCELALSSDDTLDAILDDPRFGPPEPPLWVVDELRRLSDEQATQSRARNRREFDSELWMVVCCGADAWLASKDSRSGLADELEISAEVFHRWEEAEVSMRLLETVDQLRSRVTPHFIPLIRRAFVRLIDMNQLWTRRRPD